MTSSSELLRYGIIGVGMMGCEHIRNLNAIDGCAVVAYADPHEPSRKNAASLVGDATGYVDYLDMIASEQLDVVVIATPNHKHKSVFDDVVKRDAHVLVEKPLGIDVVECQRMIATDKKYQKSGRVVWVGLEYRYMAPTNRLIDEINSGVCGDVKMISIREHRFPFLQKVENWNRFSRNTGGTLVEKCCHFFDLMTIVAKSRPIGVYASGAQDVNHLDEIYGGVRSDILDNAYVVVDFANGVRGMLDLSMFAEGSKNEQEICVVGSRAKIEAMMPESIVRIGSRKSGREGVVEVSVSQTSEVVPGFHGGASYLEHRAMQKAIRKGLKPEVTLEDGLLSVAMGQAAHLSIVEKRIVSMDEILNESFA
jgi:myo-inositol 2-dehydrogenase/D-chiro-inositol 1-dehydrogenase